MGDFALRAKSILRQAETEFAPLIEEAARTRDFDSVRLLAGIAERIQRIADELSPGNDDFRLETVTAGMADVGMPSGRAESQDFPQFCREGDVLIKLARSKAFNRPYEHRAERRVMDLVVRSIADAGGSKQKYFRAQDLEKLKDAGPVPSYQVYVVLSWLRWSGLIRQHGRAGYSVVSPTRFVDSAEAAWNQLRPASNGLSEVIDGNTRA